MPRIARLIVQEEKTVYHVMSRTALDGFPFGDVEKEELVNIIKKFSSIYFVDVLGFTILDNHFHILIQMNHEKDYSDKEVIRRYGIAFGEDSIMPEDSIPALRKRWSSLAMLMKDVKQTFSRYYNKRHDRRGTLWGERFKSVIVEKGETLINCLAYIDLNSVRAGIVERPEDYRWCSLAYHIQTNNKDNLISFDFGLKEFGVKSKKERIRRYRRYIYEAGALRRAENPAAKTIDKKILESERKKDFEINRIQRFRSRTRYFTDSGIIGTKEFVSRNYQLFKDRFQSKLEKKPKPIKGLEGVYSLKRLAEA
jgi:putative transposase